MAKMKLLKIHKEKGMDTEPKDCCSRDCFEIIIRLIAVHPQANIVLLPNALLVEKIAPAADTLPQRDIDDQKSSSADILIFFIRVTSQMARAPPMTPP
jgi:hypothetical protein